MVRRNLLSLMLPMALLGCGGMALDTPQSLPIDTYPANQDFSLRVLMTTCADSCAEYEDPECSVSVDEEDMTIELDVRVPFEPGAKDSCSLQCGGPVIAHCPVPAAPPGLYRVVAGQFEGRITLQ